jgi:hypothetical protein
MTITVTRGLVLGTAVVALSWGMAGCLTEGSGSIKPSAEEAAEPPLGRLDGPAPTAVKPRPSAKSSAFREKYPGPLNPKLKAE